MKAIILSGLPAAGKTTVAEILGKRLNLPVMGGSDILREMAKEKGYNPHGDDWWDTEEGLRFHKERTTNPHFDKEADIRLEKKIAKGDLVVTSYPMPWLTKHGFKIWLFATLEKRAERMSKRDHTSIADSKKAIAARENDNKKVYKEVYGIDYGNDTKPFDMVIDTNEIEPEEVAELIIKKMRELKLIA